MPNVRAVQRKHGMHVGWARAGVCFLPGHEYTAPPTEPCELTPRFRLMWEGARAAATPPPPPPPTSSCRCYWHPHPDHHHHHHQHRTQKSTKPHTGRCFIARHNANSSSSVSNLLYLKVYQVPGRKYGGLSHSVEGMRCVLQQQYY